MDREWSFEQTGNAARDYSKEAFPERN